MIREMARDFAQSELAPNAAAWEEAEEVPREVRDRMGKLGLMGVVVPEEWGGAGADFVSYALGGFGAATTSMKLAPSFRTNLSVRPLTLSAP